MSHRLTLARSRADHINIIPRLAKLPHHKPAEDYHRYRPCRSCTCRNRRRPSSLPSRRWLSKQIEEFASSAGGHVVPVTKRPTHSQRGTGSRTPARDRSDARRRVCNEAAFSPRDRSLAPPCLARARVCTRRCRSSTFRNSGCSAKPACPRSRFSVPPSTQLPVGTPLASSCPSVDI